MVVGVHGTPSGLGESKSMWVMAQRSVLRGMAVVASTPSEGGSLQRAGSQPLSLSTSHVHVVQHFSSYIHVIFMRYFDHSIYYLYTLVRRPRLILDFSLTILFIHLVLTTYYSSAFPTSLFVLATILLSTALTVITAEQLCVKREMAEGLTVASAGGGDDDVEMGALLRRD